MLWNLGLLAQDDAGGLIAGLLGLVCNCVIIIIFGIVPLVGLWKIFEKAGKPGWGAIIPFYNIYLLTEIAGKDIMWSFLALIPCVNFVIMIILWMEVAKNFGKEAIYGLGLAFLPFIFMPLLGFSDARYMGPQKPMM